MTGRFKRGFGMDGLVAEGACIGLRNGHRCVRGMGTVALMFGGFGLGMAL